MTDFGTILLYLHPTESWSVMGSSYDDIIWRSDKPKPSLNELLAAESAAINHELMTAIRLERNQLLSASDWTQTADAPVDAKAWAAYRQKLRDLPATIKDPTQPVDWPKPPK